MDLAALRIEARHHVLDDAVLAGRVHALEDDQQGPAVLGKQLLLHRGEMAQPAGEHVLGGGLAYVEAAGVRRVDIRQVEPVHLLDAKVLDKLGEVHSLRSVVSCNPTLDAFGEESVTQERE